MVFNIKTNPFSNLCGGITLTKYDVCLISLVSHTDSSSPSTISLSPNILEERIASTALVEPPGEVFSHTVPSPSTLVTGPHQQLSSTESAITSAASYDNKATSIAPTVTEPSQVRQNTEDIFLSTDVVVLTEVARPTESNMATSLTVGAHISGEPSEGLATFASAHSRSMQSGVPVMTSSSSSSSPASRNHITLNTVQLQTQTTSDNQINDKALHQYYSNMVSTTAATATAPATGIQRPPSGGSAAPPFLSPSSPNPAHSSPSHTPPLQSGKGNNGASGPDLTSPGENTGYDNKTEASTNVGKSWGEFSSYISDIGIHIIQTAVCCVSLYCYSYNPYI